MKKLINPLLRLVRSGRLARPDFEDSGLLESRPEWTLPPLDPPEVAIVLANADQAALSGERGAAAQPNPYPPGSRQHRLWADRVKAYTRDLASRR